MEKSCLECGKTLLGRSDKKFCSDYCRNNYYNKQNRDSINYVRNVNNILRKNRRILAALNPNGKSKVHREKLLGKGFNFNYFTNVYRTKTGTTYYFCYDQGYLPLDGEMFALVQKESYV
jgi:hypothetical protein